MSEPPARVGRAAAPAARRRAGGGSCCRAAPDVLGLLVAQGELTVAASRRSTRGRTAVATKRRRPVRAARHAAYHARRELLAALQAALSTPVDQEDLYSSPSARPRPRRGAGRLREAEVLGWEPDAHAARMAPRLARRHTRARRGLRAAAQGSRSRRPRGGRGERGRAPRRARLSRGDGRAARGRGPPRSSFAAQDLYRRYLEVAEAIVAVADRLWYVVLRGA